MRDIKEVIKRIEQELPEGEGDCCRDLLSNLKSSLPYRAPEESHRNWVELCGILNASLPHDDVLPEWAQKIGCIIRGEE